MQGEAAGGLEGPEVQAPPVLVALKLPSAEVMAPTRDTATGRSLLRSTWRLGGYDNRASATSSSRAPTSSPWATATSPPSEHLQIGGSDTVRGHDSGALSVQARRCQSNWNFGVEACGTKALAWKPTHPGIRTAGRLASISLDLVGTRQPPSKSSRHRFTARQVASW